MGLDMYLERYPRYKSYTPADACLVYYHLNYEAEYEDLPPEEDWEGLNNMYKSRDEVGYWRKANAIHQWFVNRVQDGMDDCGYHREVTKSDLLALRKICQKILDKCELVDGEIISYWDSDFKPHYVPGKIVKNQHICEELLPTQRGFFFGDTNYTEYYLDDVRETLEIVENALDTDFENYAIYYVSSW